MKKIAISLIALMVIGVGFLGGCTESINEMINPPDVEVISQSTRTGYEGLDYVLYIDVTVYNKGGDGTATVWAKVMQDSNQ